MDRPVKQMVAELSTELVETRVRIRRYTLDPRVVKDTRLQTLADEAWNDWLGVRDAWYALPDPPDAAGLQGVERKLLDVGRKADLVQRELISEESFHAGTRTVGWLATALVGLVVVYLLMHGVRTLDLSTFEPFPEWGPLKYVEVAFWSSFGVLCWLLFLAARYVMRRDFDRWYRPWYVSTALRAPFLTMILMMVILEFVEWYGEGTWIETYILEEGNKFYFIAFVSFCLGLVSDETANIVRELADGVLQFVRGAIARVSKRLVSTVTPVDTLRK